MDSLKPIGLTHRVTITVTGRYAHGREQEHATVTLAGDGSLDHMLDAYRAALVAAGYSPDTARRLEVCDAMMVRRGEDR